ncbi:hypothetical protein [Microcoleus sp. FACHB-68]|uniref:hypothetical protein n=1 Tax=Microcoleus sp. FACHB-68 TaxID=2692826 RepID=UPI001685DAAA|nr:hypothetical protein [Microcoleus sp. FACHB-68]MBD1938285.1 hypothetical protein [Microcoleus sp. FACHB-68]
MHSFVTGISSGIENIACLCVCQSGDRTPMPNRPRFMKKSSNFPEAQKLCASIKPSHSPKEGRQHPFFCCTSYRAL